MNSGGLPNGHVWYLNLMENPGYLNGVNVGFPNGSVCYSNLMGDQGC